MQNLLVIIILTLVFQGLSWNQAFDLLEDQLAQINNQPERLKQLTENKLVQENIIKKIPAELDLKVPFVPQAPLADWSMPYQEACEEAALIQTKYYFSDQKLTAEKMVQEISQIVDWEKQKFGLYTDTALSEVKVMAEEYFNLATEIMENPSVENVKANLNQGNLILVPTAGQALGNPYFSGAGPLYHFVVIRGYTGNQFIVNDVGTKRGEAYRYDYDLLLRANHDLSKNPDGSWFRPYDSQTDDQTKHKKMLQGVARMLVVKGLKK